MEDGTGRNLHGMECQNNVIHCQVLLGPGPGPRYQRLVAPKGKRTLAVIVVH